MDEKRQILLDYKIKVKHHGGEKVGWYPTKSLQKKLLQA